MPNVIRWRSDVSIIAVPDTAIPRFAVLRVGLLDATPVAALAAIGQQPGFPAPPGFELQEPLGHAAIHMVLWKDFVLILWR